jgi:hypothetical protein
MRITNNERSYGRSRRLFRVVEFYWDMLEARGCGQDAGGKYAGMGATPGCSTPISEINDHKGRLTVTWAADPAHDEKRLIETAWAKAGEEECGDVTHVVEVADGL